MKLPLFILFLPLASLGQAPASTSLPARATTTELRNANTIRLPTRDGKIFYEQIDSAIKKSKFDIYNAAKVWLAETFKDSKSVLQIDDKETGELLGKGLFTVNTGRSNSWIEVYCQFTVKISCREKKYRIQIYDIGSTTSPKYDYNPIDWMLKKPENEPFLSQVDIKVNGILASWIMSIYKKKDDF